MAQRELAAAIMRERKPRKRKTYVEVFFQDSIAGSMLRTLHACGSMTQADFMTLYHKRCARDNPSRSSFGANFGRYVKREQAYGNLWREIDGPLRCLEHRRTWPGEVVRYTISWIGLAVSEMVTAMPDKAIDKAENMMERIATRDDDPDALVYLDALRADMRVRSQRIRSSAAGAFATVATWLRAHGTRFSDWYNNGAELDDSVPAMSGDVLKSWENIRAVAESWDMTVLELLDADGIRWGAS